MIQAYIALTGLLAIVMTNLSHPGARRWAPIIGLLSQPAWLWETSQAGMWGMFGLSCAYTGAWLMGCWNQWGPQAP